MNIIELVSLGCYLIISLALIGVWAYSVWCQHDIARRYADERELPASGARQC